MTVRNSREYLQAVSPYRFLLCDDCGAERQAHPWARCNAFAHDYGDEPLGGMGAGHGNTELLGDEPHLRLL